MEEKEGVVAEGETETEEDVESGAEGAWKEDQKDRYQTVMLGGVVWIHSALTGEGVNGTVSVTYYLRSDHLHDNEDAERPS